jgi:hypothetical protein
VNDTLDAAYFTAKVNATDETQRWFPLPLMKNVTNERGDDTYETFNDNSKSFALQGLRTFTGLIINQDSRYLEKIADFRCVKFGVYIVDLDGNLIGDMGTDGFLYPIPVDNQSWSPKYLPATDTTVSKVQISFDFKQSFLDKNIGMLTIEDFESDVALLDLEGLLSMYGSLIGTPTTTSFSMYVYSAFGSANGGIPIEDVAQASWLLYNVTDAAAVTILTMTETPDGQYNFTFAAQTSGDILSLRLQTSVNGFDDAILEDVAITIP